MKKIIKYSFFGLFTWLYPIAGLMAASQTSGLLNNIATGNNGPYQPITSGQNDLAVIVGTIIETFLGLLGVIFLTYIVYAGYLWFIAGGDEQKVTKAKDTIQRATIGLIITIGAYAITAWVFDKIVFNSGIIN